MSVIFWGLLLPFFGTSLGAACVLFMKNELNKTLERCLIGFAAGVMAAASVWSLIIPAVERSAALGRWAFFPAASGFIAGMLLFIGADKLLPLLFYALFRNIFYRRALYMRQIKDLVQDNEKVWIYLSTDEVAQHFIKNAITEGFHWSNGGVISEGATGYLFGVHRDMSIAHLSMYIWYLSFQCHGKIPGTPLCIDYERYINGELD